jgi:hypothetical protein
MTLKQQHENCAFCVESVDGRARNNEICRDTVKEKLNRKRENVFRTWSLPKYIHDDSSGVSEDLAGELVN